MAIRLKDIAADCGVSLVTVSKVLRNKHDVSQATRERILRRVKELHYRPNMMARGLASGRSYTIGLIVPDLVDGFFAEVARSLGSTLRHQSYQLFVASADESTNVEREEIESLVARGVDAILLASCQGHQPQLPRPLSIPLILLDRMLIDVKAHFVGTDDIRAGRIATEHLLSLQRKRIAHIAAEDISTSERRREGFRQAMAAHDVPLNKQIVVSRSLQAGRADHHGHDAMNELLALRRRPDAVFCYNDLLAVGAIRSILAHGLRVPEDVSVIGCGNLRLASYLEVPLSSVDQGTGQLGERAATLALELVNGKKRVPRISLVEPTIVARASTMGMKA
jgi:LacI family transcriptional regulator